MVQVAAGATANAKVVMGFVTDEVPESLSEYQAYAGYSNATAFATHVRAYNLWWAQNVPYIDVPEPAIKKNIYYRWWLMRFNNLDADIPGQNFQFPTSTEGVLGYNNAIVLTVISDGRLAPALLIAPLLCLLLLLPFARERAPDEPAPSAA